MAALVGLFDQIEEPAGSMEDLDELLSATALLESKPIQRSNMMPPKSKTTLDLSAQFRASSAEMANKAIGKYNFGYFVL